MKRRATPSTWPGERASGFWDSTSAVSEYQGQMWRAQYTPKLKKRTALLQTLREVFRRHRSQPVDRVVATHQPDAAGLGELLCRWTSSRCFNSFKTG